ncbi:MAG: pyridoxal phosphate-dependent aminotransferase [Clostridiales bacterium]|nr:pyridoxal phosphate-dependent aminotransferase [Clostridiales bacterium]MDY4060706.1 pyridoxal phosphate-dependent aminotransferase [Anaerovoracaceae bacterium]
MQFVNERLMNMELQGGIYDIYQKALAMESEGKKIVHMEIGRPDFDSPQIAKEAAIEAINGGKVHYTTMAGIPELREAISAMEFRENGIISDPDSEIVVTAGACEALMATMMATLMPGDSIIIPTPYFGAYANMAELLGINLIEVVCKADKDFVPCIEDIIAAYTEDTKAIVINTPNNPTGAVIPDDVLIKIGNFAKEKNLLVISDETYSQFLYEGKHISISTLNGMKERTVVVSSASKLFSMTGWRIGYAIMPKEIVPYVNKVHENMSTCATSFAQYGAAKAYAEERAFTVNMVSEFKKRRDMLYEGLKNCELIEPIKPKGAFYMMVNIRRTGLNGNQFSEMLLDNKGIAVTPGGAFGKGGDDFIRMSYGCSREDISYALDKVIEFTKTL